MKRISIPLLFGLVALAGTATAQQSVNETRAAAASATVSVENTSGSVRVIGWNRNEVQVTGTLGRGVERLDFGGDPNHLRIRVVLPQQGRNIGSSNIEVRIPQNGSPRVSTVSADVAVTGVRGAVEVQTVSGGIDLQGERLPSARVRTVSGDTRLRGSAGAVESESVSGTLTLEMSSASTRARTASGNIVVRNASGSFEGQTVSGDARIEGGRFNRMSISSVSGDLRFRGDLERGGTYQVNSHSGDVEFRLPARIGVDFDVTTFSGSIDNAFGAAAERTSRYAPGRTLRASTGDGGARLIIRTFSGDVTLARQ
jgi:DUF4097 and DUF4098 domain-containing protein YvlB